MKTVVISGSVSLEEKMKKWDVFWRAKGYKVINYPKPIANGEFAIQYPIIHQEFYSDLAKADIHFVANEENKNIKGYIGPGVYAEIAFRVGLNLTGDTKASVILLEQLSPDNPFYDDLKLWLDLGWIGLFKDFNF